MCVCVCVSVCGCLCVCLHCCVYLRDQLLVPMTHYLMYISQPDNQPASQLSVLPLLKGLQC